MLNVAASSGRSLLCLALELHMRSACQDKLRRTSSMHLDMSVRRDQILGVFPEKIFIGTHRYYVTRLVGDYYILDTFVHENDIEERFDYHPPPPVAASATAAAASSLLLVVDVEETTTVSREEIPTMDKSYAALFASPTSSVFDYCCLVTLDGERLPVDRYRLPAALQACTINCGHTKRSSGVSSTPRPMEVVDMTDDEPPPPSSLPNRNALDPKSVLAQAQMISDLLRSGKATSPRLRSGKAASPQFSPSEGILRSGKATSPQFSPSEGILTPLRTSLQ